MTASAAQLRALLDLLAQLHDCRDQEELCQRLTDLAPSLVPCDLVSLNYIDLSGTHGGTRTSFDQGLRPSAQLMAAFDEFVSQHPLVAEMYRTGDGCPRRMSDFIEEAAFRRLDLYEHVFRPLESLHQIGFSVAFTPGMVVGVGLNRRRRDFSAGHLELVELLHRHLPAVVSHVSLRVAAPDNTDYGLTERESQLWSLIADGLSSRTIGERLFISPRTVEKHLENLYVKLGVRGRWQAIALAKTTHKP